MPPEIIELLTGENGVLAAITFALIWMTRQWHIEKESAKTEREQRNKDGLVAAQVLTEQRIINESAKYQIEMRDFRLEDTQKDLAECKEELSRYRFPPGPK